MSDFLKGLRARARDRRRSIVFPEGEEPRTLEAVAEIQSEGLLDPILLGRRDTVLDGVGTVGGDPDAVRVVDPRVIEGTGSLVAHLVERRRSRGLTETQARERVRDPLFRGALMVGTGEVDGSVAGAIHSTGDVLRAALWCVGPAEGIDTISSSFFMVVPNFRGRGPEVLSFTDCAVVPDPDAGQLAQIAAAAVRARRAVVADSPVVAFLSYSTRGSADGPSIERVRRGLRVFRDMMPGVPSDGEFQGDTALIESVARRKAPDSAVGGDANILVFPNLDAGNLGYKLVERLAGARAIGPVVQGLARPCNDLSRGARPADIVDVACITSLMAT